MTSNTMHDRSSDEEKAASGLYEDVQFSDLPPDPDAHLSEEERAAIVS
jgi:hypothetical protein